MGYDVRIDPTQAETFAWRSTVDPKYLRKDD